MKSRILRVGLILFLLLILFVIFLPTLLSTSLVRGLVMGKAAKLAPGDLGIGDWRMTWNRGVRVDDLRYAQSDAGVLVTVEQIRLEKGLLGLIREYQDLGTIHIEKPLIRLEVPEREPEPSRSAPGADPRLKPESSPRPAAKPAGRVAPDEVVLPAIAVELLVVDGRVEIIDSGAMSTQVVDQLRMDLSMTGGLAPVTYTVKGRIAEGDGGFSVEGETVLPMGKALVLEEISTETAIAVEALDLQPLTRWAGGPVVEGKLTADFRIEGGVADGVRVRGNLRLPGAALSGEALSGDHPSLGDVLVVVNATYADDRIKADNLVFRSGLAQIQATGELGTAADGVFSWDGQIDLAAMAREFANTARMQEGARLDEGLLKLSGTVERRAEAITLDASASIATLRGQHGDRAIAWDAPTQVTIKGRQGPDLLVLDEFTIASPFLSGQASGTLDAGKVHLDASMDRLMSEVGVFVDLGGWSATGDLAVDLAADKAGDNYVVEGTVSSPAFTLVSEGATVIPQGLAQVSLTGSITPGAEAPVDAIEISQLTWKTWLSNGSGTMERMEPASKSVRGLRVSGDLDLAALGRTLRAVGTLPETIQIGGTGQFTTTADVEPGGAVRASLWASVSDLEAGTEAGVIREPNVRLEATAEVDPENGTVRLPSLVGDLSAGTIQLTDTLVGKGTVTTRASGQADLAKTLKLLEEFVTLPEGSSVSGMSRFEATVSKAGAGLSVSLEGGLTDLEVRPSSGETIREESAELAFVFDSNAEAGTIQVSKAMIQSGAVQLQGQLDALHSADVHQVSAAGEWGLDLERLAGYARALLGIDLEMAGKESQPFSFESRWTEGEPNGLMRHATLSAELRADRIEAFGLTIADLDVPVRVAEGVANLAINGQVNDGQLSVQPRVDFTGEPAVLTLVDPTNLLTNIQLTDRLSEELLSKIHPLFKGASDVTGKLSMGMEEFFWPLAAEARAAARFKGRMQFTELHMATHGLLEQILAAMKVRERDFRLGDREFDFQCENERITCSPLKFRVDKYDVSIVGSMGLDQTLDYTAQIPVTESLVGRDVFAYLEGTTIHVPIRGRAAKPELDANVLAQAAGDLIRQAAQKAITENAGKLLKGLLGN